jgi:amidase
MIHELSAEALADAIRAGELTVLEVTEHTLRRAEELGPEIGAFVTLSADRALDQARKLDARLSVGPARSPLFGVPCPIKDLNAVAQVGMECGSAVLAGNVATYDDGVVTWLAEAGTVMVGKTNTPEFGFPCYTEPDNAPAARTPWDLTRSAGGSSGGAAAAVAAKIVPIAHASDGGGSIRIPAASCGLVGLKPSRGRISPTPYGFPGPGLASNGVLTRTVRDTAIGLDALAGARVGDIHAVPPAATAFRAACDAAVGRLRVGVLTQPVIAEAEVHPACLRAVAKTADSLAGLGHIVEYAPVPMRLEEWDAFAALWSVGAATLPIPPDSEHLLRPLTRWLREQGNSYSGRAYAEALIASQRIAQQIAVAWNPYDIILTPTLAQPPAKVGGLRDDLDPAADFAAQTRFTPWTSVYNVSGLPAISLPLHSTRIDEVELPIGVMLGARFGAEALLLSVSAQLEDAGLNRLGE